MSILDADQDVSEQHMTLPECRKTLLGLERAIEKNREMRVSGRSTQPRIRSRSDSTEWCCVRILQTKHADRPDKSVTRPKLGWPLPPCLC